MRVRFFCYTTSGARPWLARHLFWPCLGHHHPTGSDRSLDHPCHYYIFAWPLGSFLIRIQWLLVSDQSMQCKYQASGRPWGWGGWAGSLGNRVVRPCVSLLEGSERAMGGAMGEKTKCLRLLLVSGSQWIPSRERKKSRSKGVLGATAIN